MSTDTGRWTRRQPSIQLVAAPLPPAARLGSGECLLGAALGVFVAFVIGDETFELLGDEPADGGAASGGDDLDAVDHVVVELFRLRLAIDISPVFTCSTRLSRGRA